MKGGRRVRERGKSKEGRTIKGRENGKVKFEEDKKGKGKMKKNLKEK